MAAIYVRGTLEWEAQKRRVHEWGSFIYTQVVPKTMKMVSAVAYNNTNIKRKPRLNCGPVSSFLEFCHSLSQIFQADAKVTPPVFQVIFSSS